LSHSLFKKTGLRGVSAILFFLFAKRKKSQACQKKEKNYFLLFLSPHLAFLFLKERHGLLNPDIQLSTLICCHVTTDLFRKLVFCPGYTIAPKRPLSRRGL